MLKKLDKLILKSFVGPFVATFFITVFVLVMQFFWKYIDDLVGKGLDLITILELTGYVTITTMTLALPLAVMISSIMTFGNLGESFELIAIKSSGIPLLRFMRPLMFLTVGIVCVAFLLANYVSPVANLKFITMLYDVRFSKPAFDIKEGIFYDKLPRYAIKVGRKDKDGSGIYDVIIYENDYKLQDNFIIAEKGKMSISPDKKYLEFYLENGWRYQEKGGYNTTQTDFFRIQFKNYKKIFDLGQFQIMRTPDSAFRNNANMLSILKIEKASDSIKKIIQSTLPVRAKRESFSYLQFQKILDSAQWQPSKIKIPDSVKSYMNLIPDSLFVYTYSRLNEKAGMVKNSLEIIASEQKNQKAEFINHQVEWHRKFSLSFACLVLFMIGAPLGSIIRKGGLGMPLVIAVIFFLIFHLLNMFGEKFTKNMIFPPYIGMWLSTIVLTPIGIFLTYKAMHDSQLFNQEFYFRLFKNFRKRFRKEKNIDLT